MYNRFLAYQALYTIFMHIVYFWPCTNVYRTNTYIMYTTAFIQTNTYMIAGICTHFQYATKYFAPFAGLM